jgi:hypothetical protein
MFFLAINLEFSIFPKVNPSGGQHYELNNQM